MGRYRHVATISAAALLVVGATACGSDDDGGSSGGDATETNQVEVADFNFKPKSIKVKSGTTVTWTFKDGSDHSVKLDDGSFKSADLKDGATATHTFSTAGTFAYKCGIHNSMTGSVAVTS